MRKKPYAIMVWIDLSDGKSRPLPGLAAREEEKLVALAPPTSVPAHHSRLSGAP